MSNNIESKLNTFFEENKPFLIRPEGGDPETNLLCNYLWDDYEKVKAKLNEISPDESAKHCYTLVEDDGKAYIISNWHFVNRIGYLVSTKKVEDNVSLRYW